MWGRFTRKRTRRTENVLWRRFARLRTQRRQQRAYSGTTVGLGIGGVLALLTIVSLVLWLLRRRAGEPTPATPPQEEGAETAPPPLEEPPGPLSGEDPDTPGPTRL